MIINIINDYSAVNAMDILHLFDTKCTAPRTPWHWTPEAHSVCSVLQVLLMLCRLSKDCYLNHPAAEIESCCSASLLSASSDLVFAASCGCMGVALHITAAGGDKLRATVALVHWLPHHSTVTACCIRALREQCCSLCWEAATCICCKLLPPPPPLPMHMAMTTCAYWVIFCQVCPKADRVSWVDLLNALGHWDDCVYTTWTPDSDGVRPCQHCCHRIPVSLRPEACNDSKMPFKC
jgi:hypothetical protein